jgi:hypothetical protein
MAEQNFSSLNNALGNTFNTAQFQTNKTLECSFDLANIKPQGIDTSFLVATLTAAIQELNAKVDSQATTIAELQAKLPALTEGNNNSAPLNMENT